MSRLCQTVTAATSTSTASTWPASPPTLISSSLLGLRSRATPDVVVANDKVVMVVQPTTATTGVGNTGEQMASIQIVRFEAAAT
jgi:hypothetical protein